MLYKIKYYCKSFVNNFSANFNYLVEFRFLKKQWQRNLLTFIHVIVFSYLGFKFCERLYSDQEFFILTAWMAVILPTSVYLFRLICKLWRWVKGR